MIQASELINAKIALKKGDPYVYLGDEKVWFYHPLAKAIRATPLLSTHEFQETLYRLRQSQFPF